MIPTRFFGPSLEKKILRPLNSVKTCLALPALHQSHSKLEEGVKILDRASGEYQQ